MSDNKKYKVPSGSITEEQKIKRSRFITSIARANNINKAKEFIETISTKYSDATHNCYAFIAGNPYSTTDIGFGDDGEVTGTAGKPMLGVLQHKKIGEIVVVVTRYYGGVKLGTGGLVRAYSGSVQSGLEKLKLVEFKPIKSGRLKFSYNYDNQIQQILRQLGITMTDITYTDEVIVNIESPFDLIDRVNEDIGNHTKGNVRIEWD